MRCEVAMRNGVGVIVAPVVKGPFMSRFATFRVAWSPEYSFVVVLVAYVEQRCVSVV